MYTGRIHSVSPRSGLWQTTIAPFVRQLYRKLAEGIREGKPVGPGFAAAVQRYRLLDMTASASDTGMKQGAVV